MSVIIESIRLLSGGVPVGENRGSDTLTTSDAVYSYGGDDWGLTLTGADVNSSSFGVVVGLSGFEATNTYSPAFSNYIKVTNFGFSVPSEDVISEITVFIEAKADAEGNASIDNIKIELKVPSTGEALSQPSSDEVSLTSSTTSTTGEALSQPSSDEISITSLSPSLIAGRVFGVNSDEISITSLNPSLIAGRVFGVNSDEISITSLDVSLIAKISAGLPLDLSFSNPAVSVAWDYLFINKSKNTTTWSDKSENTTTWTNQSDASTSWKEL